MANSVKARLKAAQADWEGADARQGGGLPDGEYEGVITDVVVALSKGNVPRTQCTWDLKVTSENCNGRTCKKFSGLESADNLAWFKGDLESIEIEAPEDFSLISEVLHEEAVGIPIRFKVRSRDEFTNVDFIERLEGGPESSSETEEAEVEAAAEPKLTAAEVNALGATDDEDGLQVIIEKHSLDIVQAEVETYSEVADMIVDQLGLK